MVRRLPFLLCYHDVASSNIGSISEDSESWPKAATSGGVWGQPGSAGQEGSELTEATRAEGIPERSSSQPPLEGRQRSLGTAKARVSRQDVLPLVC